MSIRASRLRSKRTTLRRLQRPKARHSFFVQLSQKDQAITVRLLPATDPEEKTPAVKRLMALVARRIRQIAPQSRYEKTNLQDVLTEPDA